MRVEIAARGVRHAVSHRLLARAGRAAMRAIRAGPRAEVEVALVSDATITRLHQRFLRQRGVTDVITFPGSGLPGDRSIGEVVISVDRARAQARRGGWSVREEVLTLLVHGILHLGGFDDHAPRAAAHMRARQQALVGRLVPRRRAR